MHRKSMSTAGLSHRGNRGLSARRCIILSRSDPSISQLYDSCNSILFGDADVLHVVVPLPMGVVGPRQIFITSYVSVLPREEIDV